MRVWTGGYANQPVTIWAALEQNGNVISFSPGLDIHTGYYAGYYLYIPLDGLQLNAGQYSLSLYASTSRGEVGDPAGAARRNTDVAMFDFPLEVRSRVAARPRLRIKKSSGFSDDYPPCMFPGDSLWMTVEHFGSSNMEIIAGYNNVDNIDWSLVGDNIPQAAEVTDNGCVIAWDAAPGHGDCGVVATDWVNDLVDTQWIIIEPDTFDVCSEGDTAYKFVGVRYETGNDLVGVSCSLTTQYGKLCNGLDTSTQAHSMAWIAVEKDPLNPSMTKWASTGYARFRYRGIYGYYDCWFMEVEGNTTWQKGIPGTAGPEMGTTHHYELQLDTSDGTWYAYYDGQLQDSISEPYSVWEYISGTHVDFCGEIRQPESDMPGTSSDKCWFRESRFNERGDATDHTPNLTNNPENVYQSDEDERGVSITMRQILLPVKLHFLPRLAC